MRYLAVVFSLLCLTQSAASVPDDCSPFLRKHLTDGQLEAIVKSQSNGYNLQSLSKTINGKKKLALVIGESHVKQSAEEARAGIDLLKSFSFQDFEGHPTTIGMKLNAFLTGLNPFRVKIQDDEETEKRIIQLARQHYAENPALIDGLRGSTTRYASVFSPENTVTLRLEEGFPIPVAMQIHSLSMPIKICVGAISCATFIGSYFMSDLTAALVAKGIAVGVLLADMGLSTWSFSTSYKNLVRKLSILKFLDSDTAVRRDRNIYMAKSINQAFADYPDRDIMLIIVGQKHVFDDERPTETLPAYLEASGWERVD